MILSKINCIIETPPTLYMKRHIILHMLFLFFLHVQFVLKYIRTLRQAFWIRPVAHLVEPPAVTVASQRQMGTMGGGPEYKSTLSTCRFQELVFQNILFLAVEMEHSHQG